MLWFITVPHLFIKMVKRKREARVAEENKNEITIPAVVSSGEPPAKQVWY